MYRANRCRRARFAEIRKDDAAAARELFHALPACSTITFFSNSNRKISAASLAPKFSAHGTCIRLRRTCLWISSSCFHPVASVLGLARAEANYAADKCFSRWARGESPRPRIGRIIHKLGTVGRGRHGGARRKHTRTSIENNASIAAGRSSGSSRPALRKKWSCANRGDVRGLGACSRRSIERTTAARLCCGSHTGKEQLVRVKIRARIRTPFLHRRFVERSTRCSATG